MTFDVAQIDEVLATTRAVRRRLDLERPVDNQLLLDCVDLAEQAPTGGNLGSRRWIIVRDQWVKDQLGELYRDTALPFMSAAAERLHGTGHPSEKVMASAAYLAEHLAEVPAIVIPTVIGHHDGSGRPGLFDSVIQAAWSFCLALARPRPRHHLGDGRASGHYEGQGDPPHLGRHDRDRPAAGRLHEGHRLQARPTPTSSPAQSGRATTAASAPSSTDATSTPRSGSGRSHASSTFAMNLAPSVGARLTPTTRARGGGSTSNPARAALACGSPTSWGPARRARPWRSPTIPARRYGCCAGASARSRPTCSKPSTV